MVKNNSCFFRRLKALWSAACAGAYVVIAVAVITVLPGQIEWLTRGRAVCAENSYCQVHHVFMSPRFFAYNANVTDALGFGHSVWMDPVEQAQLCPNTDRVVRLSECKSMFECPAPSYAIEYSCPVCIKVERDEAEKRRRAREGKKLVPENR